MKKALCCIVAVILLIGCMPAMADGPIEVEYLFGLGGNLGNLFLSLIDEYNSSQDAVRVIPIQTPDYSTALQQYQAGLAAGNPPAMWHTQMSRMMKVQQYLEPLNDRYANDAEFNADDILAGCLSCMYGTDGETIYGAPLFASTQLMYYRKDAFEGYDIEETFSNWQNLAAAAAEIAAADNGITWGWMPMWATDNWLDAVLSAGGGKYTDETMRHVNFLSDQWIDVMTSFQKWMVEDKIMSMHFGGSGWEYWYANIDDVLDGVAAGYTGSAGDQGDLDFNIVSVHKQPGWGDHPTNNTTDTHMVVIAKGIPDEQKEAAWDFIKFLSKPSSQARISMTGGYIVTRASAQQDPTFAAYIAENPQVGITIDAMNYTTKQPMDITGGYVDSAYDDMVDRVLLEGEDVIEALTTCQEEAQAALDEYWAEIDAQ